MSLGLAVAAALTLADLQGVNGAAEAKRLLAPELAAKVVGGTIQRTRRSGQAWLAKFWEQPRVSGPAVCARTLHALTISTADETPAPGTPMTPGRQDSYEQIATTLDRPATAESCAATATYVAVRPGDVAAGQALLTRLTQAVRIADGAAALPFALSCDDLTKTEACANPRAALAALPLVNLMALDPRGALFTLSADMPTALIGRTTDDPASWIVRLAGDGATPERVELVHAEMTLG